MRLVKRLLKWLAIGALALLIAGAIFQQVGLVLDGKYAPSAADAVEVNGREVHLVCAGSGVRTFLLDAGAGAGTYEWWLLQPKLAKHGRVCAFDRAGLGWSDPAPGGYDGVAAADQLAALVKAANIPTPFVYVGHSLGANFAMIYRARHPADVSALVLIEPGDPKDMLEDFHGTRAEATQAQDCDATCRIAAVATFLGIVRVTSFSAGRRSFDEATRRVYRASLSRPANLQTTIASLNAVVKTAYEDMDIRGFGDVPVLVVASSNPRQPEGKETTEDVKKWRVGQLAYLAALAAKSSRGSGPMVIGDSTHTTMVMGESQSSELAREIIAFTAEVSPAARGHFVDVGGHRLWSVTTGTTGPTVVFVSGIGDDHGVWDKVQPIVAEFTSTLSYDRPGLGKSDPTAGPRDVETLARELHDLLVAGRVSGPYFLVGHSLGGPIIRIFAGAYPDEVAGLVLVDPEDHRLIDALKRRLPTKEWTDREAAMATALPNMPPAWRAELLASENSGTQVERARALPRVPIVLLTGTRKNPEFPGNPLEQDLKLQIQSHDLLAIPAARHLLVPESRHYIQSDAPQAVIAAIRQVLQENSDDD